MYPTFAYSSIDFCFKLRSEAKSFIRNATHRYFPQNTKTSSQHTSFTVAGSSVFKKSLPVAFANPATRLVFPTPGLPSRRIALFSCKALKTRVVLQATVSALKLNPTWSLLGSLVVSGLQRFWIQSGDTPHCPALDVSTSARYIYCFAERK